MKKEEPSHYIYNEKETNCRLLLKFNGFIADVFEGKVIER